MSELPETTPPENTPPEIQPGPKRPEVYTRLPDGKIVNIFDQMDRERRNMEITMSTGPIKAGDLIAFQYSNEGGTTNEMVFNVTTANWRGFAISGDFAPRPSLGGKLDGPNLPDDVKDQHVWFTGSGWGGSMVSPGTLATQRSPYFQVGRGEYRAPYVDNFEIFRKDDKDNWQALDPNKADSEIKGGAPHHDGRLAKAQQLMDLFGFKAQFRSEGYSFDDRLRYEDDRFIAQFRAGGAMGNLLAILDKRDGQWVGLKYFHTSNEDFLQVALCNIKGHDLRKLWLFPPYSITDTSGVHISREPITTYNSSGRYGIEVINYHPSEKETSETLNVPRWLPDHVARPDIQIFPDGEIRVPNEYPISVVDREHPGTLDMIRNSASASTSSEGVTTVSLKGKRIKLQTPEEEIGKVMRNMSGNRTNPMEKLGKAGKTIGQFIRNRGSSKEPNDIW